MPVLKIEYSTDRWSASRKPVEHGSTRRLYLDVSCIECPWVFRGYTEHNAAYAARKHKCAAPGPEEV